MYDFRISVLNPHIKRFITAAYSEVRAKDYVMAGNKHIANRKETYTLRDVDDVGRSRASLK